MKLLLASLLVFVPLTIQAEYLGNLSANEFDQNSIANPLGTIDKHHTIQSLPSHRSGARWCDRRGCHRVRP